MNSIFITGIPTVGKSTLAKKLAAEFGMEIFCTDVAHKEWRDDPELVAWLDFFRNQNETLYWQNTSADQDWKNLVQQSHALWPRIKAPIERALVSKTPTIFEGVNLLPSLVKKDFPQIPGIVLINTNPDTFFARNRQHPRWGRTETLQRQEANAFALEQSPRYAKEGQAAGYWIFEESDEGEVFTSPLIVLNKLLYFFFKITSRLPAKQRPCF